MRTLSATAFTSAIGLATNTTLGFNQWAYTDGSELFFHAGFAARNALSAVRLAEQGAFASPDALEGPVGLFASLGKMEANARIHLFSDTPEILRVYHKPVPVCNFAQAPTIAALQIVHATVPRPEQIARIIIRVPLACARYPGCDAEGPFTQIPQAKMSIQFNVAAALIEGAVTEHNFTRLGDPQRARLIACTTLLADDAFTAAYPTRQGAAVVVLMADGTRHEARLEDVMPADDGTIRTRFRAAVGCALGAARLEEIDTCIEHLERYEDSGALARLLRAGAPNARE